MHTHGNVWLPSLNSSAPPAPQHPQASRPVALSGLEPFQVTHGNSPKKSQELVSLPDGVIPEHTEPSPWGMALPAHPSACQNEQKSRAGKEFQLNLNKALEQATCKSEHLTSRRFYHLSFVALATRCVRCWALI